MLLCYWYDMLCQISYAYGYAHVESFLVTFPRLRLRLLLLQSQKYNKKVDFAGERSVLWWCSVEKGQRRKPCCSSRWRVSCAHFNPCRVFQGPELFLTDVSRHSMLDAFLSPDVRTPKPSSMIHKCVEHCTIECILKKMWYAKSPSMKQSSYHLRIILEGVPLNWFRNMRVFFVPGFLTEY